MEKKEINDGVISQQVKQKRRFLLALPAIIIPFLCLGFYALKSSDKGKSSDKPQTGLNTAVPDVQEKRPDKMDKKAMYERAAKDSLARERMIESDPYRRIAFNKTEEMVPEAPENSQLRRYPDPASRAKAVEEKLSLLSRTLEQSAQPAPAQEVAASTNAPLVEEEQVDRLERMMEMMQSGSQEDPEMEQINRTLSTILDIQHPDRVQQRLKEQSAQNKGMVYSVRQITPKLQVSLLDNRTVRDYAMEAAFDSSGKNRQESSFYGLGDELVEQESQNAVKAVIHEDQELVAGSTLKLRLANEVFINGTRIPSGTFVYGTVGLTGERLTVLIDNIRMGSNLYPVRMSVYDLDGLAGIRIPGAISRDAVKQSGSQKVSGLSPGLLDPSLGAQVASAGIELSKNILSKKIKLIKVSVKAGYNVLLKDLKQRENN